MQRKLLHHIQILKAMQVVDLLLQRQAQVNRRNSRGFTALHAAAENGHVSVMCLGCNVSKVGATWLSWSSCHHCLLACAV